MWMGVMFLTLRQAFIPNMSLLLGLEPLQQLGVGYTCGNMVQYTVAIWCSTLWQYGAVQYGNIVQYTVAIWYSTLQQYSKVHMRRYGAVHCGNMVQYTVAIWCSTLWQYGGQKALQSSALVQTLDLGFEAWTQLNNCMVSWS